jgi:ABC-type multidrug transport system ATPase subunit
VPLIVNFENAGRRFGSRWATRDLLLRIEPRTVVAVLGANGAGKSTLLRLLAGWIPLSAGRILIDDSPMRPTATWLRRRIILLEESPRQLRNPVDVLARQIKDYRADHVGIEDDVADLYDKLDVTPVYANDAAGLSKGQHYKMIMVGLFVIRPDLWLLDEPFSAGLDASGLQFLESQIRAHAESGGTVVFTSQWPEHAKRLADQAIVLHEGALVWDAAPSTPVDSECMQHADDSLRAVLQGLGHVNV